MSRHIAVIPAREGSTGLPGKNRKFFYQTADFLSGVSWFDDIIVSTNDPVIKEMSVEQGFRIHHRSEGLSGPTISIKSVFDSVLTEMNIQARHFLWLFYLPIVYKDIKDFQAAKKIADEREAKSLCAFVPAKFHPYNCWKHDPVNGLSQYIPNDYFRRQDLPPAWVHYHYTCWFRADELPRLNSELINFETYPMFLDGDTIENLIEIDTPEDLEKWMLQMERAKT